MYFQKKQSSLFTEPLVYTVSQVNHYLKSLMLKDRLLQDVRVMGEVSNFKLHKPSGHMYFTLKDGEGVLRCVFFRSKNQVLQFTPEEGMKVVARGNISLYERSGYCQLYVEEMEQEGMGALFVAFEQLKEKLRQEGIFAPEKKKALPRFPRRVGLITSPSGAAIRDFITTVQRRFPCLRILIYPVAVQGKEAPLQIINALKQLDAAGDLDVIVVARGGGSLEELWSFNDEALARTIYEIDTPVVSAVGHETDFTIADFAADCRASTPTAAAELVVPEKKELLKLIDTAESRLRGALKGSLKTRKLVLYRLTSSTAMIYPREKINQGYQRVDELWQRMARLMEYKLKLKQAAIKNLTSNLEAMSPLKVMSRGFSFVIDESRRLVGSAGKLEKGQLVKVVFRDGNADCLVQAVRKRKPADILDFNDGE